MPRSNFIRKPAAFGLGLALAFCVPAHAQGPVPVGELFASDANGEKTLQLAGSGMSVVSGSDLAAGIAAATLKLYRGGEVRICPHSGLNVTAGGRGLTLASGTGSLEVEYELTQESADILITPDFNITLAGPAKFHFALGVSKNGNTCVKPLPGNSGEMAFAESLGSGTYRTKPEEPVLFLTGKLDQHSDFTGECGCPAPAPAPSALASSTMRAAPQPTPPPLPQPAATPAAENPVALARNAPAATASDSASQVHVQVDTPFVFSAKPSGDRPYAVAKIKISTLPNVIFVQEQVDPIVLPQKPAEVSSQAKAEPPRPVEAPRKEKKGFMSRIKGFFGSIFHR
jgi:hypothetical protein